MHTLPESFILRLWNKVKVFYWLALVIVSILILFFPRTLGLPPHWRRCLVWVICIDLWLILYGFIRPIVVNSDYLRYMDKACFYLMLCQVKRWILMVLFVSAILYLPLWPIDKLLDVKREHVEKEEELLGKELPFF